MTSICPICETVVPASQLQRHANECLDRRMREAGHPELADPPRPGARARSPPRAPSPPRARSPPRNRLGPAATPPRRRSLSPPHRPRSPDSRVSLSPETGSENGSDDERERAPERRPERRPAPPPVPAEPLVVRPEEVDDLISAIHIRRFDAEADSPATPAVGAVAGGAGAAAPSARSTEWKPSFQPIKGLLYVRVAEAHLPPAKGGVSLTARTPYVDVSFEGETFHTAACSAGGAFTDEEFLFSIDHYFGGATLHFDVFEKGLLFGRTAAGRVSLSAGEIVQKQLELLRRLHVSVRTDGAGNLAIDAACAGQAEAMREAMARPASSAASASLAAGAAAGGAAGGAGRSSGGGGGGGGGGAVNLYDPRDDPALRGWFVRGVNPLLQDSWYELPGGGRIRLQLEFLFSQTQGPLGPRGMTAEHRAAAGGQVKLMRYLWLRAGTAGGAHANAMSAVTARDAPEFKSRPLDFAVGGGTEAHTRCVHFLLHALAGELDASGTPVSGAKTLKTGPGGLLYLEPPTSDLTRAMGIHDESIAADESNVIHRAAAGGNVASFCMLMRPRTATATSTREKMDRLLASRNHYGRTPFHEAAAAGATALLEAMFTHFTAPHSKEWAVKQDLAGNYPLHLAAAGGHAATVECLLRHGAPTGVINLRGQWALHSAATAPDDASAAAAVRALVAGKVSAAMDNDGARPLHLAAARGYGACVRALLKDDPDAASAADSAGRTPWDLAMAAQLAAQAAASACASAAVSKAGEEAKAQKAAAAAAAAVAGSSSSAARPASSSSSFGLSGLASLAFGSLSSGGSSSSSSAAAAGGAGAAAPSRGPTVSVVTANATSAIAVAAAAADAVAALEEVLPKRTLDSLRSKRESRLKAAASSRTFATAAAAAALAGTSPASAAAALAGAGTGIAAGAAGTAGVGEAARPRGGSNVSATGSATKPPLGPSGVTKGAGARGGGGSISAPAFGAGGKQASLWDGGDDDGGFAGDDDDYRYEEEDDGFGPTSAGGGGGSASLSGGLPPGHPALMGGASSSGGGSIMSLPAGLPRARPVLLRNTSSTDGMEYGKLAPPNPLSLQRQRSVEVYEADEVAAMQARILRDVATMLRLPLASAGILLRHYKWDAQAAMAGYSGDAAGTAAAAGIVPGADPDKLLKRYRDGKARAAARAAAADGGAGGATAASRALGSSSSRRVAYGMVDGRLIAKSDDAASATSYSTSSATAAAVDLGPNEDDEEDMCPACMGDVPRWQLVSTGCGHEMCGTCWQAHLSSRLAEFGKEAHAQGKCFDTTCGAVIPECLWMELANEHDRDVYKQYVVHSYVPLTGQVVWCPSPKCGRALRYRNPHADLTCLCGLRFCISCQLEAHSPCSCSEFDRWKEDCEGLKDILTKRMLMEQFKKCPGCGVFLERVAGCNHMTCRCKAEWCFMCKADWKTHGAHTGGYFKCNIYEKEKAGKSNADWEGYSKEEKDRILSKTTVERAKLFEDVQGKVRMMSDGMDRARHRLEVVKRAIADPKLLLKKHGVGLAAGAAAGATGAAGAAAGAGAGAGASGSAAAGDDATVSLRTALYDTIESKATRRDVSLRVATGRFGVPDAMMVPGAAAGRTYLRPLRATMAPRGFEVDEAEDEDDEEDDDEDDDDDEDEEDEDNDPFAAKAKAARSGSGGSAASGAAATGAGAATAAGKAGAAPLDPRIEFVLSQERRRLESMRDALEALYEFHRCNRWTYVHMFYQAPGPQRALLEYKQTILEGHASTLFENLNDNKRLATIDDARLREYTRAVKRFCKNLLEEVEATTTAADASGAAAGGAGAGAGAGAGSSSSSGAAGGAGRGR